jgi:urease gamma subunit
MIYVKAIVKGESDTQPFTQIFDYKDRSDEEIFYKSAEMIKEKIVRDLKINTNEVLVIFCVYVVNEIRARKPVSIIEKNASKIFSIDKVMIGVPETLRNITFRALVDDYPARILYLRMLCLLTTTLQQHRLIIDIHQFFGI